MAVKTAGRIPKSQSVSLMEGSLWVIVAVICSVGMFLCGGVLVAMLDNPVPVIALACVFAAGCIVSVRELIGPPKPRRPH